MTHSFIPLLVLCASPALVHAKYFIDNVDRTTVSTDSSWELFTPPEALTLLLPNGTTSIDPSPCYGHSYTAGICTTAQECELRIQFTGSGISVYLLQAGPYGVNASVTVDDHLPRVVTFDAPPPPNYYKLNVSVYDIQSLPSSDHIFKLNVLSYNGNWSPVLFDFAVVNEKFVPGARVLSARAATSSPPWTSPTSIAGHNNSSQNNITRRNAAIGGAIGGAVLIAIIVTAFLYFAKRRSRSAVESEIVNMTPNFMANTPYTVTPLDLNAYPAQASSSLPTTGKIQTVNRQTGALVPDPVPTKRQAPSPAAAPPQAPAPAPASPIPGVAGTSQLTPEQVNFVYGLYSSNVPAPTLARVVETLANQDSNTQAQSNAGEPPPEYSAHPDSNYTMEGSSSGGMRRRQRQVQGDEKSTPLEGTSEAVEVPDGGPDSS